MRVCSHENTRFLLFSGFGVQREENTVRAWRRVQFPFRNTRVSGSCVSAVHACVFVLMCSAIYLSLLETWCPYEFRSK